MKSSVLTGRPAKIKKNAADFNGGRLTSDVGTLLLQLVDQKLRLTERIKP